MSEQGGDLVRRPYNCLFMNMPVYLKRMRQGAGIGITYRALYVQITMSGAREAPLLYYESSFYFRR